MIRTVGILAKPRRETVATVLPQLVEWLRQHKLEAYCDADSAACVDSPVPAVPREELAAKCDLLLVLGGDGTLLAAARLVGDRSVPILPVNLGGLGFLTSVTLAELYPILEQVLAGQQRISERALLNVQVMRGGKVVEQHRALNDAVLTKLTRARIIDFELDIDGAFVCKYRADGVIVSTPTGSTAYSLSAGGPIIYPVLDAFVITPICSHTLTNRPLVVPDSMKLELSFDAAEDPVSLTLDGQFSVELQGGDRIVLTKAPTRLHLVRPLRKTYFEILRTKLKWGER